MEDTILWCIKFRLVGCYFKSRRFRRLHNVHNGFWLHLFTSVKCFGYAKLRLALPSIELYSRSRNIQADRHEKR